MRNQNFSEYNDKTVEIIIFRNHVFHTFRGKLVNCNRKQLCIQTPFGTEKWISKPIFFRDSIREINFISKQEEIK